MSSMSYQVPQLGQDFTTDFEDLVIQYLYDKWSISTPGKDPSGLVGSDGSKIQFRPGFPDYSKPFEILAIQTDTRVADRNDPYSWHMFTGIEIRVVRAYEPTRDNIAPELGNMEREIERILNTYARGANGITGIDDIIFMGRSRDYGNLSRSTATAKKGNLSRQSTVSWASSTWESATFCELSYYKEIV